jgi:hypothetical protein
MIDDIYNEIEKFNKNYLTASELKRFISLYFDNDSIESIALKLGITRNKALYIQTQILYKSNLLLMMLESYQANYITMANDSLKDKSDDFYTDELPNGMVVSKPNIVRLKRDEMKLKFAMQRINFIDSIKKEVITNKLLSEKVDINQTIVIEVEEFKDEG